MSNSSRRRFLLRMLQVEFRGANAFEVTLTYHHGYTARPEDWHDDLRRFGQELLRDYASFGPSAIWTLEFQQRGAPHFHATLLLDREPHELQLRRWVADTWNHIAEQGDDIARKVGTRVDRIRLHEKAGVKRLMLYLAKYKAKAEQKALIDRDTGELLPTGRMWGTWGEPPVQLLASVELGPETLAQLCRRLRRWGRSSPYLRRIGRDLPGALILGDGRELVQLLRGLADPDPPDP